MTEPKSTLLNSADPELLYDSTDQMNLFSSYDTDDDFSCFQSDYFNEGQETSEFSEVPSTLQYYDSSQNSEIFNLYQCSLINLQSDTSLTQQKFEESIQSDACFEGSNSRGSTRASKRKIDLSRKANMFKKLFYQIFTSKKKFPKQMVKKIHEIVCAPLFLKKMSREQFRRIDLYFQENSQYSERILIYLQQHKEELLDQIPELSELK